MKNSRKITAIVTVAAVILAMLSLFCGAAGKTYELVKPESAGGESWDVIDGVWSGTLSSGSSNGGVKLDPVERTVTQDGHLLLKSNAAKDENQNDHGMGNYIGVSDILKPNTEYTLSVKAKFDTNKSSPLHALADIYGKLFIFYNADVSGADRVEVNHSDDFVTYTYKFKTGADVSNTYIQVGPVGVGDNTNFGAFCPGASLEIASAKLEGDLLKSDTTPGEDKPGGDDKPGDNPPTGSYVLPAVICMAAVAGCAVAVKKHGRR